jgi:hypothetical protein
MQATLRLEKVQQLLRPQVAHVNIAESGAQQLNVTQTSQLPPHEETPSER